ncbi:MAG TPA: ABC transporter permease [Chitinophagaceae bacterium]|nr:ABC transporter permease [Chitinophagaceae bacterium]
MLKNYFIVALRNFSLNKTFSIINVLGLSIGISAAVVIFLIVHHEFSYDTFQKDNNRIFRVVLDAKFGGTEGHSAAVPAPLGAAIEKEITGIEQTIPVFQFQGDASAKVEVEANNPAGAVVYKKQPHVVFTNQQYFSLLSYQWLAGSELAAMQAPFSVVLTQSRARQYFPSLTPIEVVGKQIKYNDIPTTVSGVVRDLDQTTDFTSTDFISLATIAKTNLQEQFMMTVWNDWMAYTQLYVRLSDNAPMASVEKKLNALLLKYNKDANKDADNTMALRLQPLRDIHFNPTYQSVGLRTANKQTLYGLIFIASFLLLLGCTNFINLTTARSVRRAKEIGIRKTMGSSKKQLVIQFLSETFLVTIIATIASILLVPLLLKMFIDFIPPGLHFNLLHQPALILFLAILVVTVSFLSGLYPALILSGYKTISVLKGQTLQNARHSSNAWVRKTLTVSQFVIAQFFIIGTLMVSKQMAYTLNADMGFNKEAILTFELPRDTVAANSRHLLRQVQQIPEVGIAATGFLPPASEGVAFTNVSAPGSKSNTASVQIRWGDPNYLEVYGVKLLAGRNVMPAESIREFIINETYAKTLGYHQPEDAIGTQLNFNGQNIPIVGIMRDFHDQSFHSPIGPLVFGGSNGSTFHIKLRPNKGGDQVWQTAISKIRKAYMQVYPGADFQYTFFDELIGKMYVREQHTSNLLRWATALAIFISCLGLLGLVIYTTNTRTKEIGIRKVLGASVLAITSILSKDFIRLVLLAFVIAAPLAWWACFNWLQDFAYRTPLSWWVFLASGIIVLLLSIITLSFHTIKAASTNPVENLRTE